VSDAPYSFAHTTFAADVHAQFAHLDTGASSGTVVAVAGRAMLVRPQGKLAFATLRDSTGEVQLFASQADTQDFERFCKLRIGDWVGATGEVIRTRRGELSVKVADWVLLAETRHGFGDKWLGISDPDLRYRRREADLWANPEARAALSKRFALTRAVRERLWAQGFVEVETPILNAVHSGGALPFSTHHNALDADFTLRIAPELWLKRLVVGGYERVFELGRLFRNEGISPKHNPEFTTVEVYAAYLDYKDMMTLTEELIAGCVHDVCASTSIAYQGRDLDMAAPWPRRTMAELVSERLSTDVSVHTDEQRLRKLLADAGGDAPAAAGTGKLLMALFDAVVEPEIWDPVFVTEYPLEVSPLARRLRGDDLLTERFEAFCVQRELANGFSELTDPDEQRKRFELQAQARALGDDEAFELDEDFVVALEYGLPPTAGLGIGIDRLAMIVADVANIREVVPFPTLKPRAD
jgi:lysyl-tRNA synthetase class 2